MSIHTDKEYEGWLMNGKVGRNGKAIHPLDYYFKHHCGSGMSSFAHNFRNPPAHPIQGMPPVTCKKCLERLDPMKAPQEVSVLNWFIEGWKWRETRVWFINWKERYPQPWRVNAIWEGYAFDGDDLSSELIWFERKEQVGKEWKWVGLSNFAGDKGYSWPVDGAAKLIVIPVDGHDGWKTRVGQRVKYDGKDMVIHRHATERYCHTRHWKEPAWCLTFPDSYERYQQEMKDKMSFQRVRPPETRVVLVDSVVELLVDSQKR